MMLLFVCSLTYRKTQLALYPMYGFFFFSLYHAIGCCNQYDLVTQFNLK